MQGKPRSRGDSMPEHRWLLNPHAHPVVAFGDSAARRQPRPPAAPRHTRACRCSAATLSALSPAGVVRTGPAAAAKSQRTTSG